MEYVDAEVANYAAVIQTRAAVALGRIGTSGAVGLLTVALDPGFTPRVPYRPDVREALRRALRAALDRRGAGRPAIRP